MEICKRKEKLGKENIINFYTKIFCEEMLNNGNHIYKID